MSKKKKKIQGYFLILSFLLANACIWIIDFLTPRPLPNIFVWFWLFLYTFIIYKKFINEFGSLNKGELNDTLGGNEK